MHATLAAAVLALAVGVQAGGLFVPVGGASGSVAPQSTEMTADVRRQSVWIARQELHVARYDVESTGEGRLLFNMPDGAHFDVAFERTVPTKFGYSLSGGVAGGAGGFVTLVVHEEAVAGFISTPDSEYQLSYIGDGIHTLRDVTNAPPLKCGGALRSELSVAETTAQQGGPDDGSVVDILVVWTPEAEEEYGGEEAQVLSHVELLVAYANDAFERSGAFVALNLVGAERVEYAEVDSSTDLSRLEDPADGYMDNVHDRRDGLGADLVYLMTARDNGVARTGALNEGAFSVGAGTSQMATFAHEVGHNMGLDHDRREAVSYDNGVFPNGFTTEHCVSTIMAYGTRCGTRSFTLYSQRGWHRQPFYASPWRYDSVDGVPLGVTRFAKERGVLGPADAVVALNRNRHRIANFRPSRGVSKRDNEAASSVAVTKSGAIERPRLELSATTDSETAVDIPDAILRQSIEDLLSKDAGDPITRGEMSTIRRLYARGSRGGGWEWPWERGGVRDLTGIEYAVNLLDINLSWGTISDLAPLAGLTSLTSLHLGANRVSDVGPLAGLTSLSSLTLFGNRISNLAPLAANRGLGQGDYIDLTNNPVKRISIETHISRLLNRGVDVRFDALPELPDIPDMALREAVDEAIFDQGGDLSTLQYVDGTERGIEDLAGLQGASGLYVLYLDRNRIADIAPLAGLDLWTLTVGQNVVEDWTLLAGMALHHLALDGNSLRELPPLSSGVTAVSLTDNSISDLGELSKLPFLATLRANGNSITSLEPLTEAGQLKYLHMRGNQIADISPLNFEAVYSGRYRLHDAVVELHIANNAVRDISPLLDGEELLMVDVRRNPLADNALTVLETLRERRVTVLAGETVPYFPAAGQTREGFVRIVNRSDENSHVFIEAVDDVGVRFGPVRLDVGARRAVHFDSAELEDGDASKGLDGIGAPTTGDWWLSVISALDVEVLSYIRTEDGFLTTMHDVLPDAMAPFFNPASNERQRSILRVVNTEAEPAKWTTGGYDDGGKWHPMAGSLLVRPQHALTLTASALENEHGLGDGRGKWRLRVRGFPWFAMSLLENPTGHLTNLSTAPAHTTPLPDGATLHRLPLFPAAGGLRKGFVRVINRSYVSGEVAIQAVDDDGTRFGPVRLAMRPWQAVYFDSMDLEAGNAAKGLLGGVGVGEGDWRLELTSELDLMVLSYARTADGFLTAMHDLAPVAEDGSHRVVFFNPGSNTRQVSKLRLINDGERRARVTITGIDDAGSGSGTATLALPAGSALTFASAELETGSDRVAGGLDDGEGRWRLRVRSNEPIAVMSLLETPGGLLSNMSTGTAD